MKTSVARRLTPPTSRLRRFVLFLLLAAVTPWSHALAQEKKPRDLTHFNLGKASLAIAGFDPVAYFPDGGGKPKKGLETITTTHEGVLYRFANEDNRKKFLASPAQYEPQYGGWCAFAMADKDKVEIDPESFVITDGKLFLFFKAWYADTRAKWSRNEKELMTKADKVWKEMNQPKPKPKDG